MLRTGFAALLCAALLGGAVAGPKPSVVISGPREPIRLEDQFTLDVRLENSGQDSLVVFGYLAWGHHAGFVLHVARSGSGEEVAPRGLDDSSIPPGMIQDRLAFVRLYPGQYLGCRRQDRANELFDRPGEYLVWVEYLSPVPKRLCPGADCWSRANGTIESNRITVRLRRIEQPSPIGAASEPCLDPCGVRSVRKLPFKGEGVDDESYNRLVSAPEAAVPCLIEAITDTTPMPDPRQAPVVHGVVAGDVAFWVLLDISGERLEMFLPESVARDFRVRGVYAYFDFVSHPENRRILQTRVRDHLKGKVFRPRYGDSEASRTSRGH